MSILIKGMKMPKSCDECQLMQFEDTNCVPELYCGCPIVFMAIPQGEEHRPDYCPLIELLPHGRLIDADALKKVIKDEADFIEANCGEDEHSFKIGSLGAFARARGCIRDAPTIIEAEDSFFNSLKRGLKQVINGDVREMTITETEEN